MHNLGGAEEGGVAQGPFRLLAGVPSVLHRSGTTTGEAVVPCWWHNHGERANSTSVGGECRRRPVFSCDVPARLTPGETEGGQSGQVEDTGSR